MSLVTCGCLPHKLAMESASFYLFTLFTILRRGLVWLPVVCSLGDAGSSRFSSLRTELADCSLGFSRWHVPSDRIRDSSRYAQLDLHWETSQRRKLNYREMFVDVHLIHST